MIYETKNKNIILNKKFKSKVVSCKQATARTTTMAPQRQNFKVARTKTPHFFCHEKSTNLVVSFVLCPFMELQYRSSSSEYVREHVRWKLFLFFSSPLHLNLSLSLPASLFSARNNQTNKPSLPPSLPNNNNNNKHNAKNTTQRFTQPPAL